MSVFKCLEFIYIMPTYSDKSLKDVSVLKLFIFIFRVASGARHHRDPYKSSCIIYDLYIYIHYTRAYIESALELNSLPGAQERWFPICILSRISNRMSFCIRVPTIVPRYTRTLWYFLRFVYIDLYIVHGASRLYIVVFFLTCNHHPTRTHHIPYRTIYHTVTYRTRMLMHCIL